MKKILFLILLVFCSVSLLNAQALYEYVYDEAGNRIARKIIHLSSKMDEGVEYVDVVEDQLSGLDVQVFPNPTKGLLELKISGTNKAENYSVSVFDAFGKLIIKKAFAGNGRFQIDLSNYPNGYYIVTIFWGSQKVSYKIIKN